jgi:hypothetical protein
MRSFVFILFGALLHSAAAHAQLIVRKEQRLAGLTVDVYSVVSDAAAAETTAGTRVGGLAPDMFEATIAVQPGRYEIRAAYVVGQPVSLPLDISVMPDTARSAADTVTVGVDATPVIVDLALAEMEGLPLGTASVAARYEHACEPAQVGATDWSVGERCANLAYIQSQKWAAERAALQRSCDADEKNAPCPAIALKEQIWTRARQGTLERGCRFGSPRACAAWDGATEAELDRECRAKKDTSWVACLRMFARDQRPLFYDARYEPELPESSGGDRTKPVDNGDSVRVAIGLSGWRSPERQNPIVVLPFAMRTTLLGRTPIGRLGFTATFAFAVQHLPVLEPASEEIAGSYQLIGVHADVGPSWSPFFFIRIDGGAFYQPAFNQSASTAGLKAELALILGDHELSAMTGFARIPNLTREADGATHSSIGGADLTFYGLSYFYAVRDD